MAAVVVAVAVGVAVAVVGVVVVAGAVGVGGAGAVGGGGGGAVGGVVVVGVAVGVGVGVFMRRNLPGTTAAIDGRVNTIHKELYMGTMKNLSTDQQFCVLRLRANNQMPYFGSMLFSAVPVCTDKVPTAAVDKHGRMYYNPTYIASIDKDEAAGVIIHEIMHLAQLHHRRCAILLGPNPDTADLFLWNIAADLTINPAIIECGLKLPPGCVMPAQFKFPENLSMEQYYDLLKQKMPPPPNNYQPGGSAADGQQREWEHGPPQKSSDAGDGTTPEGISDFDQTIMSRQAAEKIEHAKAKGNVPAGLERWAEGILRPKIDPKRELLARIKHGISQASGMRDFTYRRPSRRKPQGDILYPSLCSQVPRVTVCIDTSGSMGSNDLGLAVGLVAKLLESLPDQRGVLVLAGDTQVAAAKKVFRPEHVQLSGGGGTNMVAILEDACSRRPRPQLVVLITDGETDWPAHELPVRTVTCLTRDASPPTWMPTVKLVEA